MTLKLTSYTMLSRYVVTQLVKNVEQIMRRLLVIWILGLALDVYGTIYEGLPFDAATTTTTTPNTK